MESKEKFQIKHQNIWEVKKIMRSLEYYKWKDLKSWMQTYLKMIKNKMENEN